MGLPAAAIGPAELRVGEGLAGWVAVTGEAVTIPGLAGPSLHPSEPDVDTALAVPILVRNRTYAVLALYGRMDGVFREEDVESVQQFVLLLPEADPEGARVVAEKLRRAVADKPIRVGEARQLRVTVSVGVATFPSDG